jgi:hypothetical protein
LNEESILMKSISEIDIQSDLTQDTAKELDATIEVDTCLDHEKVKVTIEERIVPRTSASMEATVSPGYGKDHTSDPYHFQGGSKRTLVFTINPVSGPITVKIIRDGTKLVGTQPGVLSGSTATVTFGPDLRDAKDSGDYDRTQEDRGRLSHLGSGPGDIGSFAATATDTSGTLIATCKYSTY